MAPRSATPKPEKPDRAEAARQRLAAKTSGSTRRTGPVLARLPPPKTIFAGRTMAWIFWAMMALNLVAALVLNRASIAVIGQLIHAGYYANFSRTDPLAFQVRLVFLVLSVVGAIPAIRLALYVILLGLVVADLLVSYNAVERALYLLPFNRSDNPEEFSIDFLVRAFTEAPTKSGQAFSMKPKATGAEALGAVSSKKSKKG